MFTYLLAFLVEFYGISNPVRYLMLDPVYRIYSKVKSVIIVEGGQKAPFAIATILRYKGSYKFPGIVSLYPWYVPYIAEC